MHQPSVDVAERLATRQNISVKAFKVLMERCEQLVTKMINDDVSIDAICVVAKQFQLMFIMHCNAVNDEWDIQNVTLDNFMTAYLANQNEKEANKKA